MKSKVMTIANNLVKQGMSRSAAMVQAWITVKLRRIETILISANKTSLYKTSRVSEINKQWALLAATGRNSSPASRGTLPMISQ